jgi:TatD DNase family protein
MKADLGTPLTSATSPVVMSGLISTSNSSISQDCSIIDIGINLTSPQLRSQWKAVLQRARDAGVSSILTSTSIENCEQNLRMCREWNQQRPDAPPLCCTLGIHPHHAKSFNATVEKRLRTMIAEELTSGSGEGSRVVVAIGECGLDFNRNLSPREDQICAFQAQLQLAIDLNLPLFIHDREATSTVLQLLDSLSTRASPSDVAYGLPPIVIHCFTGSVSEMREYVSRGFFIGVTGIVCHRHTARGRVLRELLPLIPLDRLMVETDAPYLSPWSGGAKEEGGKESGRKGQGGEDRRGRASRCCEPMDVVEVLRVVAEVLGKEVAEVREALLQNTKRFFRLPSASPASSSAMTVR